MSSNRGTGPSVVDPALIRQALKHSDHHKHRVTALRYGVAPSTVTRWRNRRTQAAATGRQWPSGADIAYWQARQPDRARGRTKQQRWQRRRAQAGGPLFVDATGTMRRLQALAALGHRYDDIGAELGAIRQRVEQLTNKRSPVVHQDTAAAVAAVYERMSLTTGPSPRCRALARNRGWQLPEAWDGDTIDDPAAEPHIAPVDIDEVAVERAMAGDDVPLNRDERRRALELLAGRGHSDAEIADRLRITRAAVQKFRARQRARTGTSPDVAAA